MTTAHKPTWMPAKGGLDQGGNRYFVPTRSYSSRDLPGYLNLKQRIDGQGPPQQLKNFNYKSDLLKRQAESQFKKKNHISDDVDLAIGFDPGVRKILKRPQDQQEKYKQDEDDPFFMQSNSSSDDQKQEQEKIWQEFNQIKKQRQEEEKKKVYQRQLKIEQNKEKELLKGNPINQSGYSLSKRWYQDTVFKNQAKIQSQKKSFINDNVRSDFHRKFINKFVMR